MASRSLCGNGQATDRRFLLSRHRISRAHLGPGHPAPSSAPLLRFRRARPWTQQQACAALRLAKFRRGAAAIAESLGLSGAIGVGHSMGGHAVTLATALQPPAFSALVLFDPVIRAPEINTPDPGRRPSSSQNGATNGRRRKRCSSASKIGRPSIPGTGACCGTIAIMRFSAPATATSWPARPTIEASIYDGSTAVESNIYPEIATIQIPVHVVRAGRCPDPSNVMGASLTAPGSGGELRARNATLVWPRTRTSSPWKRRSWRRKSSPTRSPCFNKDGVPKTCRLTNR